MELSIIVPVYNEEENIRKLIEKIEETLDIPHELIVVNDHSTDNTWQILRELSKNYSNIKLVENTSKKGFANALRTGFKVANRDLFLPVMADLCDDLSTVKNMLSMVKAGYDVVCGCRYIKGGARIGGSKLKAFLSFLSGLSLHYLIGIPTRDVTNSFKLYKKVVINNIKTQSRYFEISMEITLKAYYQGFKIIDVPTIWKERTRGRSSFKIIKLLPYFLKWYLWAIYKRLF